MPRSTRHPQESERSRTNPRTDRAEPFPVDVEDHGDSFLVAAELPGRRKQDLDVAVRKDKLQIVADGESEETSAVRRRGRPRGEVRRVIRLPEAVDERRVSASYSDGILWITARKRHRPKRVEVE